MSRTMLAMPARSTLINPSGPSSDGVVLMLKRDGVITCSSRVPMASDGCIDVSRSAMTGSRGFTLASVSLAPGAP